MRTVRWIGMALVIVSLTAMVAACTPAAAPAAPASAEQPAAKAPLKIKVGTNAEYRPFEYVDESGKIVGFDIDLITEMAKRAGYEIEIVNTKWDGIFTALAAGEFDAVASACTITDERKQQVDFSAPYMTSQQFMLVRADEKRFSTPTEFAADEKLLIGSQTGTTSFFTAVYDILDGDEANPRIKLFENFGAAVQALLTGDVDLVLMDAASSRGYIGANPNKLKTIGDPLGTEEFGFIFKSGSDLVQPFDAAIASMKQDGYLESLNTKWFFLYQPG